MSKKYLPHIYDPLRRKIGEEYLMHEFRKLFPSIRDKKIWDSVDTDVSTWFEGNHPSFAPVRDFWNGLHGVSVGFKLKNIVSWATSKNIEWSEEKVALDQLNLGTTFEDIKPIGEKPATKDVIHWFNDPNHKEEREKSLNIRRKHSSNSFDRNHYAIFVVERKGVLRIIDGNRRVLLAILEDKTEISAYVGRIVGMPPIFESWIPTNLLIDLVSFHRYFIKIGRETITEHTAHVISELVRESQAGRYELVERVLRKDEKADQLLFKEINKIVALN